MKKPGKFREVPDLPEIKTPRELPWFPDAASPPGEFLFQMLFWFTTFQAYIPPAFLSTVFENSTESIISSGISAA